MKITSFIPSSNEKSCQTTLDMPVFTEAVTVPVEAADPECKTCDFIYKSGRAILLLLVMLNVVIINLAL